MRGLVTAFPNFVRGLSQSYGGHRFETGHKRCVGNSPPWHRLQPCTMNECLPRCVVSEPAIFLGSHAVDTVAGAGPTWRAMSHKKAAISRAIAVVATVARLP